MPKKKPPILLICAICVLSLVLIGLLGLIVVWSGGENTPDETVSTVGTTDGTDETVTLSTEAAATEATTIPTTEATTVSTEPQPEEFVLSFAGDCVMGNLKGSNSDSTFMKVVGDNYAWPFAAVQEYFATDDCTFINLENPLTNYTVSKTDKEYVFKGPPEYTQILTTGSVEFANVVNNHTKDYGTQGYQDTQDALTAAGVHFALERKTTVFTTESGLTIGVYVDMYPNDVNGLAEKIAQMRADGAEVIVVCMHWGEEYYYKPTGTQKSIAHKAIDAGADIVYGHHPHVLQPIEEYKGKMIYYSLGNFSFGGNNNPPDKDTAILQQTVIRDVDGTIRLGELKIIPCRVTGAAKGNDYQPVPLEEGTEAYERTLKKLAGNYHLEKLTVSYREDDKEEETVPGTTPGGSTDATQPVESTPAESTPAESTPAESTPAQTEPAPTESQPAATQPQPTEAAPAPSEAAPAPSENTGDGT